MKFQTFSTQHESGEGEKKVAKCIQMAAPFSTPAILLVINFQYLYDECGSLLIVQTVVFVNHLKGRVGS